VPNTADHLTTGAGPERILPFTRWLAIAILPFLIAAWVILYLFPQNAAQWFAWPIQSAMSARLMASGYLAGAYFFFHAAAGKSWRPVRNGFLPVALFAALMGLTTLLHWSRFTPGHPAFITWAVLYFTTPFLIVAAWLSNRCGFAVTAERHDVPVPVWARRSLGALGCAMLIAVLSFYIDPQSLIQLWPWVLTPLTARAILGFFFLPAVTKIALAFDPDWNAHRLIIQGQVFALALILLGAAFSRADFTRPGGWVFLTLLGLVILGDLAYDLWMEKRSRGLNAPREH
jgi:hypothetical protein